MIYSIDHCAGSFILLPSVTPTICAKKAIVSRSIGNHFQPSSKDKGFAEMLFSSAPTGFIEVLAAVDTIFELGRQSTFDRFAEILKRWDSDPLSRG